MKFPGPKVKKGTKSDSVTLQGLHLCCGGCEKAVKAALKKVAGVDSVDVIKKKRTIVLSGKAIDVAAVLKALNSAGFSGSIEKAKKKDK